MEDLLIECSYDNKDTIEVFGEEFVKNRDEYLPIFITENNDEVNTHVLLTRDKVEELHKYLGEVLENTLEEK